MADLIDRQAAIDAINRPYGGCYTEQAKGFAVYQILSVPSAQLTEIIHCKDCKHSEHWYRDKARCFLWHEEGIDVFENGFCNYGEKRVEYDSV